MIYMFKTSLTKGIQTRCLGGCPICSAGNIPEGYLLPGCPGATEEKDGHKEL